MNKVHQLIRYYVKQKDFHYNRVRYIGYCNPSSDAYQRHREALQYYQGSVDALVALLGEEEVLNVGGDDLL